MAKQQTLNKYSEKGSVLIMTTLAIVVVIALIGLAMDGGAMYVSFEKAQAAADAAAQAGVMDMYRGTSPAGGTYGAHHPCTTTDNWTPCWYARQNGFGGTASDSVTIDFAGPGVAGGSTAASCTVTGVPLSSDPVNLICVKVQRTLNTMLMEVIGESTSTVAATAMAAITLQTTLPIPIVITHPTLSGSLSTGGAKSVITICGGPSRSIQVNSSSPTAISNPNVDLSHAGLSDPNGNCTGTGADFGILGGPAAQPNGILTGTTGHYLEPASPITDPLATVSAPPVPTVTGTKTPLANGVSGCPASPKKACQLYSPGLWSGGIDVKNETAVFMPGIYYITGSTGFVNDANGVMGMATGFTDGASGTNTGWTGNMLVYNTGTGTFSFNANSNGINLVGSCLTSTCTGTTAYEGILFFQDRTAAAATHDLSGGGQTALTGTIYITNTLAIMQANPAQYQTLSFGGHGASTTNIIGEYIVSQLTLGGSSTIQMFLTGTGLGAGGTIVRQVALVK